MMLPVRNSPGMERNEDEGMKQMSEEGVDFLVPGKASMAAVMSKDEDGPHEEACEEPKEWKIGGMPFRAIGHKSAVVQRGDEGYVPEDVVDAEGEVGSEAMLRDDALDL